MQEAEDDGVDCRAEGRELSRVVTDELNQELSHFFALIFLKKMPAVGNDCVPLVLGSGDEFLHDPVTAGGDRVVIAGREHGVSRRYPGKPIWVGCYQAQADQAAPILTEQGDALEV